MHERLLYRPISPKLQMVGVRLRVKVRVRVRVKVRVKVRVRDRVRVRVRARVRVRVPACRRIAGVMPAASPLAPCVR